VIDSPTGSEVTSSHDSNLALTNDFFDPLTTLSPTYWKVTFVNSA